MGSNRPVRDVLRGLLRNWRMLVIALAATYLALSSRGDWIRSIAIGLVATGVFCNVLVMGANQGRMPAQTDSIPSEQEANYQVMNGNTRIAILGDWIQVRDWLISPGDVCLYVGLGIAVASRLFANT
jgi:hypothetical protein